MFLTTYSTSFSTSESILTLDDSSECVSGDRVDRQITFLIEVMSGEVKLPEKSVVRTLSSPRLHVTEKLFKRSKSALFLHESKPKEFMHEHGKVLRKIGAIAKKLTKKKHGLFIPPQEEPRKVCKSLEDVKVIENIDLSENEGFFDPKVTERLNILILVAATQTHHLLEEPWDRFEKAISEAGLLPSQQQLLICIADEKLILDEVCKTSQKLIQAKEQFKETKRSLNEEIEAYKNRIASLRNKSVRFGEGRLDALELKNDEVQLRILEEKSRLLPIVSGDPLIDEKNEVIEPQRLKIIESPNFYVDFVEDVQKIRIEYECFLEVSNSVRQFEFRKELWLDKKEGNVHHVEVQYFLNRA